MCSVMPPSNSDKSFNDRAEKLFFDHGDLLLRILRKELPGDDARDILQNLFLEIAVKGIPENVKHVRAYLCRAVKNDIADYWRKQKTKQQFHEEYTYSRRQTALNENPEKTFICYTMLILTFMAMKEQIRPALYEAFMLKHVGKLDNNEIAHKMKIEMSTVNSYLSLAEKNVLKLFQQRLRDHDE